VYAAIDHLNNSQIINSYNFARNCDLVFSEIISRRNYEKLDKSNHIIIFENDSQVFYKATQLKIKSGDIIFSNTYFIESLFNKIRKTNLNNLIVVTSQTDIQIDDKLYSKKPPNVSKWYSINVSTQKENLHPIPYGLANEYSPKNVFRNHLINNSVENKIEKIYVNFELNTNYFHRKKILKKIRNKGDFYVEKNNLKPDIYAKNLGLYKYILCPWGNGFDTHRLWESLYSGAIAIVPKHQTFLTTEELPVVQYENINNLNIKKIFNSTPSSSHKLEKLNIDYWVNEIKRFQTLNKSNEEIIIFDDEEDIKNYKKYLIIQNRYKKINTNLRKIHSKLLY